MDYKERINRDRRYWIGRKVLYEGPGENTPTAYTVVDVDYSGALLIDKPATFTDTTAVAAWMVQEI